MIGINENNQQIAINLHTVVCIIVTSKEYILRFVGGGELDLPITPHNTHLYNTYLERLNAAQIPNLSDLQGKLNHLVSTLKGK